MYLTTDQEVRGSNPFRVTKKEKLISQRLIGFFHSGSRQTKFAIESEWEKARQLEIVSFSFGIRIPKGSPEAISSFSIDSFFSFRVKANEVCN